jgi:LPXTG-motif cell wall-anchored protein
MTGNAIGAGTLIENHNPQFDGSVPPSFVHLGLTSDGVPIQQGANLLATLTFDTTGFGPGYSTTLELGDTASGDTFLADIRNGSVFDLPLTIHNGSITIVPEPGGFALAGLSLLGMISWAYRRRKRAARL